MTKTIEKQPEISACMMVKDEEKLLPQCLKSIQDHVDEIIIVDTGSRDNTIAIAESYGARVYHHPWEDHFSKHRNQSLEYARGSWLFIIDADEELRTTNGSSLRDILGKIEARVDGLMIRVDNMSPTGVIPANSVRLVRNNRGIHYQGRVHNYLVGPRQIVFAPLSLFHHGYNLGKEVDEKKFKRTTDLLLLDVEENPNNPRPYHFLAVSCQTQRLFEQSKAYSEKAIQLFEKGPMVPHNYLWSLYIAASSCFNLEKTDEAIAHARKAIAYFPNHLDSHFILCAIALKEDDLMTFRRHRDAFIGILEKIKDSSQEFGEIVHNTYDNEWLILLWEAMLVQNWDHRRIENEQLLKKGRHLCGDDIKFHMEHGRLSASMGRLPEAEKAYRSVLELDQAHGPAKMQLARVLLDLKQYGEAKIVAKQALHSKDADSILPLRVLALAHYHLHEDQQALEAFQRVAELDRSLLEPHAYLAEIFLKTLDIESCVHACDQLLEKLHLERNLTIHSLHELAVHFFKIAEAMLQSPEPHLFRLCLETGQALLATRPPSLSAS